ncbi:hypothetical protein N1851_017269 [Merluccius polli]|uniref:Uncharacterized protein n=1 Tax=Merluccius polli TaxID=89951 RepID=A0AA47MPZ5_MERPO|nr:hypothetical protein N1851_017269 [Merluccius polli]
MQVKWSCLCEYAGTWFSSPSVSEMPKVNWMTAVATLFSGTSTLNLWVTGSTTYNIWKRFLLPAIEEEYKLQRNVLLAGQILQATHLNTHQINFNWITQSTISRRISYT